MAQPINHGMQCERCKRRGFTSLAIVAQANFPDLRSLCDDCVITVGLAGQLLDEADKPVSGEEFAKLMEVA